MNDWNSQFYFFHFGFYPFYTLHNKTSLLNKTYCSSNKNHIYFSYYQWKLTNFFLFYKEQIISFFFRMNIETMFAIYIYIYILWIDFSCWNGIYLLMVQLVPNCHIKKYIECSVNKNLLFLENQRNKINNKTFKIPQS